MNNDQAVWDKLLHLAENGIDLSRQPTGETVDEDKIKKQLTALEQRQVAILRWVADGTIKIDAADVQLQAIKREINAMQKITTIKTACRGIV